MNKVILVTGAGRGLGNCVAKRHAELGDKVYAYDVQITDELRALEASFENLHAFPCDISSTQSVNNAMEAINKESKIDILYNIAGIFRFEDFAEIR